MQTPLKTVSPVSTSVVPSPVSLSSAAAAAKGFKKHGRAISVDLKEHGKVEHEVRTTTFALGVGEGGGGGDEESSNPLLKKKNSLVIEELNKINLTKRTPTSVDDTNKINASTQTQSPQSPTTSSLGPLSPRQSEKKKGLGPAVDSSSMNFPSSSSSSSSSSSMEGQDDSNIPAAMVSAATMVGGKFVKRGKQVGKKLFEVATLGLINDDSESDSKGGSSAMTARNQLGEGRISSKEKFAIPSLHHILDIMGVCESDISQIIEMSLSKADKSVLKSDVVSEKQLGYLFALRDDSTKMIDEKLKGKSIVKIQSVIRSWKIHRRTMILVGDELDRQTNYNTVFRRIVEREKRYIVQLRMLIDRFLVPIRARSASGKEVIRLEELTFLFCNVESITEEHSRNLRRLESLFDLWPFVSNVGKVFLELAPSLKSYHSYISNFKNAQDTLSRLKSEKGKFSQFLQEVQQRHPDTNDLLSLLSAPIHHLSKLEPLFESLAEFSKPGSDDQREVNNAFALLSQTNVFMNQSMIVNTAELVNIQRKIIGLFIFLIFLI